MFDTWRQDARYAARALGRKADGGGSGRCLRLRSGLLVAQIAFSMLLLVTAGRFARALVHARSIDAGFDASDREGAPLVATWIPARRAAAVDPVVALRAE